MTEGLDYNQLTFSQIRRALIETIPSLTDRWTDHNPSDLGMVLLELFAHLGDELATQQNVQAAESFLRTAQKRQSVIDHCALIGYTLKNPVPASTVLRLTSVNRLNDSLTIHKGTVFYADIYLNNKLTPVPFTTTQDVLITPQNRLTDCNAIQGASYQETFISDGATTQKQPLYHQDVAEKSINITANDFTWNQTTHLQESGPSDRHFLVETNGLNVSSVSFGDGKRGMIPTAGTQFNVSYLRTLGAAGNLGAHLITRSPTTFYLDGHPITLTVTNPIPATGGADRESIKTAKERAPALLESLWRGVTKRSFEALATNYPGVGKAQVIDVNDCAGQRYFRVNLVVAPNGGGPPSPYLLEGLTNYLEARKTLTQEFRLHRPNYIPIDVHVRCRVVASFSFSAVRENVEAVLIKHLSFDNVSFGSIVRSLDLRAAVETVAGVVTATILFPTEDRTMDFGELPSLGNLQIDLIEA